MQDEGVEVGSFEKPNLLASVWFVTLKNLRLKARGWLGTLVEILIPTIFMVALVPAYVAAGSSSYGNREFIGNHFDVDAFYKPYMCRTPGQAEPSEYAECVAPLPLEGYCLGNLCLNGTVPNRGSALTRLLDPWFYVENSTSIPSYDVVAVWRHFAQSYDLPGIDTFSVKVANALRTGDKLAIVPNSPEQQPIADRLEDWFSRNTYTYNFTKIHFETEKEATRFAKSKAGSEKLWALVVVRGERDFVIRMNRTATASTDDYNVDRPGYDKQFRQYLCGGFVTIQALINWNLTGTNDLGTQVVPMPIMGYERNGFLDAAGDFLPIVLTLAFLFPMAQIVSSIVKEKEARIREAMLIMGLSSKAFKLSWVLTTMLQMTVTGFLLSLVVVSSFLSTTDYSIIFMLFWSYCISLAAAGILLSVFFSKASLASIVSPMVFLLSAIPSFILTDASSSTKASLSIFNTFAFSEAVSLVYKAAAKSEPMTWSNAPDGSFSFSAALAYMWFDTVLYLVVALWLDQVLPSEWGAKKPLCYYCWPPYWFKNKSQYDDLDAVDGMMDKANLESIVDPELRQRERVQVKNLRKEFTNDGQTKVAVNNVNLTLYEGQILALLGHNGAGKTTMINMLTGMLPVTSGDAQVYGNSIRQELESVRRDIGLCPQHNILWDNMTCAEHLRFYGQLKGIPRGELEKHVDDTLAKVELSDKKETFSAALSGGMKRKLSVGISLMGGPRFIILDEPTAGMDVQARRAIWDLLKTVRAGRTILLTTHFMDEADLLGDSIAILHGGRVNCWGSSFFLKQKLGVGYNLTLELTPGTDVDNITRTITEEVEPLRVEHAQPVELLSNAGAEVSYRVPMWGVPNFASLFERLEVNGKELGISTFGMSVTTLEEIFIKIAHDQVEVEEHNAQAAAAATGLLENAQPVYGDAQDHHEKLLEGIDIDPSERMQDNELFKSQWRGLFYKRFKYSKRDKCTICFQLVLPVVLIAYTLILAKIPVNDLPSINLFKYGEDSVFPVSPANSLYADHLFKGITAQPSDYESPEAMSTWLLHRTNDQDSKCWQGLYQDNNTYDSPKLLFQNTSAMHSIPIALNSFASSQLGSVVHLTNHPFPFSDYFRDQIAGMQAISIATNIMLPFCFIPANYVAFLVKERVSKSKHVQVVSGVKLSAYWLSNFLWDLMAFMVSTMLSFIVFFMFDRTEYIGDGETFFATLLLFFFYGVTAIFAAYLASFYFEKATTGQNTVLMGNYMSGFVLVIVVGVLQIIPSTESVAKPLRFVFRIVPAFCLGDGILALSQLPSNRNMGVTDNTAMSMDVVGWDILFLCIMFPVYALLALAHDFPQIWYKLGLRKPPAEMEDEGHAMTEIDEDVAAEKRAVMEGRAGDVVRVQGVRKVYPPSGNGPAKVAVKEVTFGVKTDEIFAFLGTNGAGKTTTISVLAGDFPPTSGCASIKGYDVVTQAAEAKRELGYCPQFDALLDLLTPREHIELYAALRGVPVRVRETMSGSLMRILGLEEHADTVCKSLSGGNKRKTSIAISLIGGPSCILLDEPTAGMDPVARRGMWTALQSIGKGRCVVLTTHHLEEVEALAHRTAIMVDGGLQCLGTLSHLKHKFGGAYEVQVKVEPEKEGALAAFFVSKFAGSKLVESTNHRFTYQMAEGMHLSQMFSTIQAARSELGIVDYSISETSLEQVFIAICRKYMEDEDIREEKERASETTKQSAGGIKRSIQSLKNSLGF